MSLNFSIESILSHGNVEPNSTLPLITSGLNQTNFLDESTSAFLKKQHLNYLSNQTNSTSSSSTNSLNNHQLNETINNNLLQSQLLYLNNLNKQNLIDNLQTRNGSNSTINSSSFGSTSSLELNHLNHLNSLQFQNHLAQLTQFNRYHYLNKLNSIYNLNQNDSSITFKNLNQPNLANGTSSVNLIGVSSNESQCSPLSNKSSEMLLNYDDSSESQHSGNNVSINSNNNSVNNSSKSINQLNLSNSNKDKDAPLCTKCKLHGMRNKVKGHKKICPKKDCTCELCDLTEIGKKLRGKKVKKRADIAATLAVANALSNNQPIKKSIVIKQLKTPITTTTTTKLLMNIDNLNSNNLNNSNLNDNSILLSGLQSTTPNSNSNSSCSNVSMSTNALASLHQPNLKTTSTNNPNIDSLTNEQLYLLEKSAKTDYMKIVINILKDKLAQDGLNFNEEIRSLNVAVIYLLLNKFGDKNELYTKFLMDA